MTKTGRAGASPIRSVSPSTRSRSPISARIALLRAEIVRIEAARAAKQAAQGAADAFFKRS